MGIAQALTAYYLEQSNVTAVVGIRQDLGLPTTVLGWTNDVAGITRQDAYTAQRIKARDVGVQSELDGEPGGYAWQENEIIVQLAADVVRFRVLGDLALKAVRSDVAYRDVAREYFAQANDALKAAFKAMADALKPQTTEPEPERVTHVSQSVPVNVGW